MAGILSTGVTGIQAAQLGLQITQHNISNVNTPGFSRQYLLQSANVAQATGSGFIGNGTTVDSVRRAYDSFLTKQTFAAQSRVSESETMYAKLSQIDNMFGDASSGLTVSLQEFFKGVQQVAANPSLVSARQSMISTTQNLVARFNSMQERLGELYDGVNGEVANEIAVINSYAKQLGSLNSEIMRAQAASQQPANDLLDQRDQLIAELNKHIKVSTVEDSTGAYNVFVGSGQQLVVGSVVNQMTAVASSNDPERIVVGLKGATGNIQELPERLIQGGSLGGLLTFRSGSLDTATNALGTIAASLALTFNAQHALGQDLGGLNATSTTPGFQADYFQVADPRVLGPANAAVVTASFLTPSIDPKTGSFYTNLTGSDYQLRNVNGNLTLTRLSDGKPFPDPAAIPTQGPATTFAQLNQYIASEGIAFNDTLPNGSPAPLPTANVDYLIEPTRQTALGIKLNPAIAADTSRIAVAAPVTSSLGSSNTGTLAVSQGSVSPGYRLANLTAAVPASGATPATPAVPLFSYDSTAKQFSFTVGTATSPVSVKATYSDGSFQMISVAAPATGTIDWNNPASPGGSLVGISYDVDPALPTEGISVTLSGLPANGDTFSIGINSNGVSDSRNAVKLANLQTQKTMKSGEATFQGAYASMVSLVGNQTRQVKVDLEARSTLLEQSQLARSAASGVNLDEEAANLIKYQQAYQAAAKSLEIASKLFDSLLNL